MPKRDERFIYTRLLLLTIRNWTKANMCISELVWILMYPSPTNTWIEVNIWASISIYVCWGEINTWPSKHGLKFIYLHHSRLYTIYWLLFLRIWFRRLGTSIVQVLRWVRRLKPCVDCRSTSREELDTSKVQVLHLDGLSGRALATIHPIKCEEMDSVALWWQSLRTCQIFINEYNFSLWVLYPKGHVR